MMLVLREHHLGKPEWDPTTFAFRTPCHLPCLWQAACKRCAILHSSPKKHKNLRTFETKQNKKQFKQSLAAGEPSIDVLSDWVFVRQLPVWLPLQAEI